MGHGAWGFWIKNQELAGKVLYQDLRNENGKYSVPDILDPPNPPF